MQKSTRKIYKGRHCYNHRFINNGYLNIQNIFYVKNGFNNTESLVEE